MDDGAVAPGTAHRAITRRDLLRLGAASGLGTGTVMIGGVGTAFAAPARGTRPDALVVINLRGGMDALTAIPPVGDPAYAAARPSIAIPASAVKKVDDVFGLHPALAPLYPLWDAGRMAVVHAAGRTTVNRSHLKATLALERAGAAKGGWIDRLAAAAAAPGPFTALQLGDPALPTALIGTRRNLATGSLDDLTTEVSDTIVPLAGWQGALATLTTGHAALAGPLATALAAVSRAQGLVAGGPATEAGYPGTAFGQALHDVARLIRADLGLRVATVDFDGWDMHVGIGAPDRGWMVNQLNEFATTVLAFADDLGPDLEGVMIVALSEFGRRVAENGSGGTDHGHGGAILLLGGGVKGGKVYGTWPTLASKALVDGDLAVTTDYRQVLAEIVTKRCGVAAGSVFPGLAAAPLGVVAPLP